MGYLYHHGVAIMELRLVLFVIYRMTGIYVNTYGILCPHVIYDSEMGY